MRDSNQLSAAFVRTVTAHGVYSDGNGLTLRVDKSGKRWVQRVTINGKRRNIGLGGYPVASLKEAREQAMSNAKAIGNGLDPILEKRRAREVALSPTIPTFAEAAQRVIEERPGSFNCRKGRGECWIIGVRVLGVWRTVVWEESVGDWGPGLLEALREIEDPRKPKGVRHPLPAVLALSVCAMLSGARSLYAIAQWGREHPQFAQSLGFSRERTPCVATLHHVFRRLDVDSFESALGRWAQECLGEGEATIAIDGKALRGIHGGELPGVRLVAAYAGESGLVLGQSGGQGGGQGE